jgi:serine protease AprX
MRFPTFNDTHRRKAVWGPKRTLAVAAILVCGLATNALAAGPHSHRARKARPGQPNAAAVSRHQKLDKELSFRADHRAALSTTKVIVTLKPGAQLPAEFRGFAKLNGKLGIINGQALNLPNGMLKRLSKHANIFDVHFDRPLEKENYRTSLTTGARAVNRALGLTGAGIGVAVIDSGVSAWHDDLTNSSTAQFPYGNQRVSKFVDFVNGQTSPYDGEGHGTHVAGIIAGNGYDSNGQKTGVAPDASIIALKVLDANGQGTISNIVAALDWVLEHHAEYNIRVVNMSVGASVSESYWTDPLTLAAKRVVDAGVLVVAAAGNKGKNAAGQTQYGAIVAPGNAPWVLTVGASSTNGTPNRADDTMGGFSSRGPTYIDWAAKPDLVAPGVGTVSMSDPTGTFYVTKATSLLDGLISTPYRPYLSLSGTSMAAPVVAGTAALMLQANPTLTPNAIKAILQYTAELKPGYNSLTEGAGFLNTLGAVRLAKFYATAQPGDHVPTQAMWGKRIIWGNHRLNGGFILPTANAFQVGTNWGVSKTAADDNIVWGTACDDCDNIVWGTADDDNIVWGTSDGGDDNIVWGTSDGDDNIVWGTDCGGADCDNIVWGTADDDNIVWGTADGDDNIVWGTADGDDNIVWGTADDDNIVWGTADDDNIVWGTADDDNIVWGTDGDDNIVWGTATEGGVVWTGSVTGTVQPLTTGSFMHLTDEQVFFMLSWVPPVGGSF